MALPRRQAGDSQPEEKKNQSPKFWLVSARQQDGIGTEDLRQDGPVLKPSGPGRQSTRTRAAFVSRELEGSGL